ncbi:MAG TPA: PilN domain-containing protein [Candidatus Saccharibacteria bacterium]|mgnify:FL=1|nr:PilN domain-containing protein [Candidatus Saccharibacteria bacterium]HRQ07259.1 PilN domain-containing protein [Candidatus Saccharibacteria bacterium]
MINLLPDDAKRQIKAGRTNIILIRYMIFLVFGAIFLTLISAAVYLFLMNSKANAEQSIKIDSSKDSSYLSVQAQAAALRSSLTTAKSILDQEISYSNILDGIAKALPQGVVIDTLSLSASTLGTPITIQARAKSTEDALKLKDSFQKSPLFSNFSLQSISTNKSGSNDYPVTATISVIINKGVNL